MAAESGLVILVPDAERLIGSYRERLDPSAAAGMPAHVTVLYPFLEPSLIDGQVERKLAGVVGTVPGFEAEFPQVGAFSDVLYLAPEPASPFHALTEAVWSAFPETPPYGGAYAEVTPHLTVGHIAEPSAFTATRNSLLRALAVGPVPRVLATEITLVDNSTGRWRVRRSFSLRDAIFTPR